MRAAGSLTPTPEISHESPGSSQCLLEYLLNRLQSSSCHVKLKVGLWWGAGGLLWGSPGRGGALAPG